MLSLFCLPTSSHLPHVDYQINIMRISAGLARVWGAPCEVGGDPGGAAWTSITLLCSSPHHPVTAWFTENFPSCLRPPKTPTLSSSTARLIEASSVHFSGTSSGELSCSSGCSDRTKGMQCVAPPGAVILCLWSQWGGISAPRHTRVTWSLYSGSLLSLPSSPLTLSLVIFQSFL